VCGLECALKFKKYQDEKEFDKETRRMKKARSENDVGLWAKKAQAMFNCFIRLRDAHLGCISCDKPSNWVGQWAAGHYRTVGAHPELRFDEDNAHKQCNRDCNGMKSGNIVEYRIRLVIKIGEPKVLQLESDDRPPVRYRLEDYKQIWAHYKAKVEELKTKNKFKVLAE